MKILSAEQIREADRLTMEREPIASIDLMERAAVRFVDYLEDLFPHLKRLLVVCGRGNNGGDGLAIARLLHGRGLEPRVVVLPGEGGSNDFKVNLQKLAPCGVVVEEALPLQFSSEIMVDALFGTGLSKPVEGLAAHWIQAMNASGVPMVSVDIPSGLAADGPFNSKDSVIKAHYTGTFQVPKLAFFMPESAWLAGRVTVLDIGLDQAYLDEVNCHQFYLSEAVIHELYQPRPPHGHKGTFGHAFLQGGSRGKMGAMVLSARACLAAGAGLVTVAIPEAGNDILQTAVPEAMTLGREGEVMGTLMPDKAYDAVGLGPGMGTAPETAQALKRLLQEWTKPLVLDADALNILADNKTWMGFLPPGSILTPHPGEFRRLVGRPVSLDEMVPEARTMALRFGVYIVLKGYRTCISTPSGKQWFNATGNSGLATGGSGDVLTGLITGLLAQGYEPFEAAALAVYVHGKAAEWLAHEMAEESITAGMLPVAFGKALRELRGQN